MVETRAFVVHQISHWPKKWTNGKHENQFFQRADGIIEQTAGAAGRLGARSNTAAARRTHAVAERNRPALSHERARQAGMAPATDTMDRPAPWD